MMQSPRLFFAILSLASTAVLVPTLRAAAQDPAPESSVSPDVREEPSEVEEAVIVRGRRQDELEFDLRLYIREFLDEIAAPARGERGYARWQRTVCVGVDNLEQTPAQYIVDRISMLAVDVGLEPGEPGCRPDVYIVFSTDAAQMASGMVENDPRAFRPVAGNAGMDRGIGPLDEFMNSDKAIRWWHVSLPVSTRTGRAAIQTAHTPCFRPPPNCYPVVTVAGPSRLHSGIRDDLLHVIIIVDVTKLAGKTWQQIGDYLALVALAQIDLEADPTAFDSILNLFSSPGAYSGLTDWDRQYVHALYSFRQDRISLIQGNEIVSLIAKQELSATE